MPRPSLFDHPKFNRLVRTLGMPKPYVLGHLEYLWRVGCSTGNPVIGDGLDVEIAAEWQGEQGVLAAALEQARFLDRLDDGRLEIHDLFENAPEYVSKRAVREAQRKLDRDCEECGGAYRSSDPRARFCSPACRTAHWRNQPAKRDGRDGAVTDDEKALRHVTERDTTNSTAQHGTVQNQKIKTVSSAASSDATKPAPTKSSPTVIAFPTIGAGGSQWALTQQQLDDWSALYPGIDVLAEARKALAWVVADEGRRKTAGGMPRFLVNWLNREANRPRTVPDSRRNGYVPAAVAEHSDEWEAECQRLHGKRCGSRYVHAQYMAAGTEVSR